MAAQSRPKKEKQMIFHKAIENLYKAQLCVRCDDKGLAHYFSHKDFDGLTASPYVFHSSLGHELRGCFYAYGGADTSRLFVFDHGFGGGHRSYMKEIERLCAAGFRVFAYDHTGCMESGGEGARGFAQSLCDLDDCLTALKADPEIDSSDISVMGHSWGGFSTLNIPALHPDVKRIVVLSGFISVEAITAQNFSGLLRGYRKHILAIEAENNPKYVSYDATRTLAALDVRALLIYSDNDSLVHKDIHYDALKNALQGRENTELWLVSGKGHNPNYTKDAVICLGELAKATERAAKLKTDEERARFRDSFDWHRMTAQDDEVWERIIKFLK